MLALQVTHFKNIWDNLKILIPFGIGIVVGIVLVAKLIEYLLKKYEVKTYFGVIGFVFASIIAIILPLFLLKDIKILELIIGIILMIIGSLITYKISNN